MPPVNSSELQALYAGPEQMFMWVGVFICIGIIAGIAWWIYQMLS